MTVTIYGASDDLVEVDGCEGADEFSIYSGNWQGDLVAPDGSQMRVYARYEDNGCWSAGAAPVDDDERTPFPLWPVRLRRATSRETAYSAVLEVGAPDGTKLTIPARQP